MADLVTLTKVKEYLGITGSGDDALIENLIDRVSGEIQSYCGQNLTSSTATAEKVTVAPGSHICQLRHYPAISITSVYEGGEDGDLLVADTDYEAEEQDLEVGQIVRINAAQGDPIPWNSGERAIVVTYTYGYSTLPEEIEGFALALVAYDWLASPVSTEKRFGVSAKAIQAGGSHSYRSRDEIWNEYRMAIEPYRKVA